MRAERVAFRMIWFIFHETPKIAKDNYNSAVISQTYGTEVVYVWWADVETIIQHQYVLTQYPH